MEIVISIIIGIAIVFIMINFINRKKIDEFDDFSRKKENKENKGETDNVDRFGHKITSIDDIVEVDYSDNYQGNDEVRNEEYNKTIFSAYEDMFLGDFKRAKEKLERASGLSIKGNYELGKFYYYCKKDKQNAVNMFNFAYNDGVKEAAYYLGMFEEKEGNIQLALDWYNEGMKKGDINSTIRLGKIAEGNKDYENARKLFTEAINYNERGYLELAKSYYAEGKGEKTKEVFEKAYEIGVKEAAYKLGQYMDIVEGNEKESEKWYKIGQEMGDARAIYQLAMLYETSREFGKSEEEAYGIFEISANMKYAPAIMDMAFYSDRAENKNKVKEWTSKLLNETGLIELGKNMIGDAQNLLEEMGEKIEDKISGKDYEIEYDEDLIYFIKKFKSWN